MSSDVTSVRAEIKAWERNFKETNGREPNIGDIKKQPALAQKYKLYKKLSKAATTSSSSSSRHNDPPSTPPKPSSTSKPPPMLLLSASHSVEAAAPLESFNPFSPQKRGKGKGMHRDLVPSNLIKAMENPLTGPRKFDIQISQRHSSPDPFPLLEPGQPSTSTQLQTEPLSAISRARKRLRGEPVSPSPNKEKRRRVLSPASLPFPKLHLQASGSESEDGGGDGEDNDTNCGNSSFVDDSPMKPTANGKAFTILFEEAIKPASTKEFLSNGVPAAKAQSIAKGPRNKLPGMDGGDVFSDNSKSNKMMKKSSMKIGPSARLQSSALSKSRPKLIQTTLPVVSKPSIGARKGSPSGTRTSAKHIVSETDHAQSGMDNNDTDAMLSIQESSTSTPPLLPPSPNPNSFRPSGKSKPNGARSNQPPKTTNRKKAKLRDGHYDMVEDMETENESSSDSFTAHDSVKLVHYSRGIRAVLSSEEAYSEIEDSLLNCAKRVLPRGESLMSLMKQGSKSGTDTTPNEEDEGEDLGIDNDEKVDSTLPDELRRVLELESLKSRHNQYEEEMVVKKLFSGRRVLHYDPKKGGEIWGVGENYRDEFADDEEQTIAEGTDEWEGDPIPWEVGELSEFHYHSEEL